MIVIIVEARVTKALKSTSRNFEAGIAFTTQSGGASDETSPR